MALGDLEKWNREVASRQAGLIQAIKTTEDARKFFMASAVCSTERETKCVEVAFDIVLANLRSDLDFAKQMEGVLPK